MRTGIDGRVAVVKGIGRATARLLADEGARLGLAARSPQPLEAVADELGASGTEVLARSVDVGDLDSLRALAAEAADRFGTTDIVVNNAGGESGRQEIHEIEDQTWERVYRLNVLSAVALSVAALEPMRRQRWGRIVNVTSYTARVPEPFCAPYAAAKAALVNVTRNFTRTYAADGVLANCVLPGLTRTDGSSPGSQQPPLRQGAATTSSWRR